MNSKHLYTIRWTQPYATYQMRPYMRMLRDQYEAEIEAGLERGQFDDARTELKRIMSL
jgi:hypothetical protein